MPKTARRDNPVPFSQQVFPDDSFEAKWKEDRGRLYDIALLFTSQPRSRATKATLRKILDAIWDLIPEQVQLIARNDLDERCLYNEWPKKPVRKKKKPEDALDHIGLEEVDDGKS